MAGQVLAVLREALTAGENCRQSKDDPTIWGIGVAFLRYASLRTAFLRDAFLRVASLRYAFLRFGSLRVAFAWCLFALCLFACWLFAWCLFACCLFALCLFACCLLAWCLLTWCLFLRDTYMIVAFSVLLPFIVVFFCQLWLSIFQIWLTLFTLKLLNFVIDIPSYISDVLMSALARLKKHAFVNFQLAWYFLMFLVPFYGDVNWSHRKMGT